MFIITQIEKKHTLSTRPDWCDVAHAEWWVIREIWVVGGWLLKVFHSWI